MSRYTARQTAAAVLLSVWGLCVAAWLILAWLDRVVRRAVTLPGVSQ